MTKLIFKGEDFRTFRQAMLSSPLETAALVLARPVPLTQNTWRLVVADIAITPDWAYRRRSGDSIELAPEFLVPFAKRARHEGLSVIQAHTHPFAGNVGPSYVDIAGEVATRAFLFGRAPNGPHGRLILGPDGYHAAMWKSAASDDHATELWEVGKDIIRIPSDTNETAAAAAFDRQIRAFGNAGQDALHRMYVAIVGVGGIGSLVAQQLAHLGVRRYLLIDPDAIDETNLNRVVGASKKDVGEKKVDVVSNMIRSIRGDAAIVGIPDTILKNEIARRLLETDAFFCCTDNHGSRAVLTQLAYQYLLPGFDSGVRIDASNGKVERITGRVQMLSPSLACLVCSEVLDPEQVRRDLLREDERRRDPYIVGGNERQPAVISINSTVASLAVTMFLSATTGVPIANRLQLYRGEIGSLRGASVDPNPKCVICSPNGALAQADKLPLPGWP